MPKEQPYVRALLGLMHQFSGERLARISNMSAAEVEELKKLFEHFQGDFYFDERSKEVQFEWRNRKFGAKDHLLPRRMFGATPAREESKEAK